MKFFSVVFYLCLVTFPLCAIGQNNPIFEDIVGKLVSYSANESPEKTYIKTDKDLYITGETIWYNVFLLNGTTHSSSKKSKVVYVELLNAKDSVVVQQKLFSPYSSADGNIDIPETSVGGNYQLRAFTKYMQNEKNPIFHTKEISINATQESKIGPVFPENIEKSTLTDSAIQEKPLISFFPEGGNLVSGLQSGLGFKVTDSKGNGIALKGKLVDDKNNMVSLFESHSFGLGKSTFIPDINREYFASVIINGKEERYPLPPPLQKGYTLSTRNAGDFIILNVATNLEARLKGTMLLGHIRGQTFFKRMEDSNDKTYSVKLFTNEMEDGVAHFTLFTSTGEPVCERLLFVDNPVNDISLSINLDKKEYRTRDKVSLAISIQDLQENFLNGNLSASVVTNTGVLEKAPTSIKSWLLLNSDIGGTVPDANFFFEDTNPKKQYLLDVLMLTHGWRRFVWKDMLSTRVSKRLMFEPEKGIMIEGKTTSYKNKYQPEESAVSFNILGEDIYQTKKPTNARGEFSFGPFIFQDSIKAILTAEKIEKSSKTRQNDLAIYVEHSFPEPVPRSQERNTNTTINYIYPQEYLNQAFKEKRAKFEYSPKVIQLKEVTVKSQEKRTRSELVDEKINEFTIYREPDARIFADSIPNGYMASAIDLLRNVIGVRIVGGFPNQSVVIRGGAGSLNGSNTPLFLLDGFPMELNIINKMMANEIMFVDVLKGGNAAIYGVRGANGVVAMYSYVDMDVDEPKPKNNPGITNFTIDGFHKTREFYSPNYKIPAPKHIKKDYRTTLFWDPQINFNDNNLSNVSFFTGDEPGTYLIQIEGITLDGRTVSTTKSFVVYD